MIAIIIIIIVIVAGVVVVMIGGASKSSDIENCQEKSVGQVWIRRLKRVLLIIITTEIMVLSEVVWRIIGKVVVVKILKRTHSAKASQSSSSSSSSASIFILRIAASFAVLACRF